MRAMSCTAIGRLCALCLISFVGCQGGPSPKTSARLDQYMYEDTKHLVMLVEAAAGLVEQLGTPAFGEFAKQGSRWLNDRSYVFVYDIDGYCLFHPINPELVGQNVIDLKDMNGQPMIRRIAEVGRRPECDASGWLFYLWEDKVQLIPGWKASYLRKAIAPDGRVYIVGSGLYNIKVEKVFVKDRVSKACGLLQAAGKEAAFAELRDPASPFHFFGNYVFVMDMNGRALLDPAYPTVAGRNLTRFQDAVGRHVVQEIIEKLRENDETWIQYMWPVPGNILPSRKLAYARKVRAGGETVIVGSDFFLATPIWMRL